MEQSFRTALISVLLLILAGCSRSSSARTSLSPEDRAALQKFADEDCRIVTTANWDTLAAEYAQDAVRMPPNSPAIEGRTEIRRFLDRVPPITECHFEAQQIAGNGDLAFMRASYSMTASPPGAAPITDVGKILVVFRQQPDGAWVRLADAWNANGAAR